MTAFAKPNSAARIFANGLDNMGTAAARQILQVTFTPAERRRIRLLQDACAVGKLTDKKMRALDSYVQLSNMLTLMHLKAKQALKRQPVTAKRKIA